MGELLIGMILGAMVATETGRNIGNQVGDAALKKLKQAAKAGKEESNGESA